MPKITVNDVKLYYEFYSGGDEVMVPNNGVIASTATWAYQLPAFAPRYRVLLYDMRGQGQSQKRTESEADNTWETHTDDLAPLFTDHRSGGSRRRTAPFRRCRTRILLGECRGVQQHFVLGILAKNSG